MIEVLGVWTRINVGPGEFEATCAFYAGVVGEAWNRFTLHRPEGNVEVARFGERSGFLILAADQPLFDQLRPVKASVVVRDIDAARDELLERGAFVMRGPLTLPIGRSYFVRHPDGVLVEYVQLDVAPPA